MATNPAATLKKWKQNSTNSQEAYKEGVSAVTVAPTQLAAAAVDKYQRGVNEAVSSGRFVNNLNAVSLSDWQTAAKEKGAANFINGVTKISARSAKAMADQQAYAEQVRQQIASMPNNTEADAEQRALAAIRLMREYKKR